MQDAVKNVFKAYSACCCNQQHLINPVQAFTTGELRYQQQRRHNQACSSIKCEAVVNTSASAKRGNEVLFAAVEVLFKIPPLFNMAVKQVRSWTL